MNLHRRIARLEEWLKPAPARPDGARAIADPCPACRACVYIFRPFAGLPPEAEAGVGMCGLCRRHFVTWAGAVYFKVMTESDPDGPLARALAAFRSGADRGKAGAEARRVLGVPDPASDYWARALEAERNFFRALQGRDADRAPARD